VQLASNGLITNELTLAENPALVEQMAAVFLKALAETIADPEAAYEISLKYVDELANADRTTQTEVLRRSIELWRTENLGHSDPQAWENMQSTLLQMGLLNEPLDLSQAFTNEFVD
jgi:NitT/TauT family transport system substrate-binding protein